MPHMKKMKMVPSEFKMGDKLTYRNREWTIDGGVVRKVKFATVSVEESQDPFTLRVDTEYPIEREVPTARETYMNTLRSVEDQIRSRVQGAGVKRLNALDALRKAPDPGYWDFRAWTLAKAEYICWAKVTKEVLDMDSNSESLAEALTRVDEGDLVSALESVLPEVAREVWRRSGVGSSEPFSVAEANVSLDVWRDWFDNQNSLLAVLDAQYKVMEMEERE